MKKQTPKKSNVPTLVALGAGAVALAASTYYLFGPAGKIHRKKAAGWMLKMKGEIVEKIEEAGEMSEMAYQSIVDSVLATQLAAGKISAEELTGFATGLKGQWKNIVRSLGAKKKKTAAKSKTGAGAKKSTKQAK